MLRQRVEKKKGERDKKKREREKRIVSTEAFWDVGHPVGVDLYNSYTYHDVV